MSKAASQSNKKIQFNKHGRALKFKCDSNKPRYSESSFPTLRAEVAKKWLQKIPCFK